MDSAVISALIALCGSVIGTFGGVVASSKLTEYRIKEDEFFTRGHFPGNPIVPGVILCEIMAQSCAILVKDEIPGHITLYAGLNEVRFKNSVRPGDTCEVTARIDERKGQLFFCTAKLEVNGKLCCKGKPIFSLVPIENGK